MIAIALLEIGPEGTVLIAMYREVQHPGVVVEGLLGGLSVVDVKIDNQDLLGQVFGQGVSGRDCYVVKEAVAAELGTHSVVTWGTDDSEAVLELVCADFGD